MPYFFRTYQRPAPPTFEPFAGLLPFLSLLELEDNENTEKSPCDGPEERRGGHCRRGGRGGMWGWGGPGPHHGPSQETGEATEKDAPEERRGGCRRRGGPGGMWGWGGPGPHGPFPHHHGPPHHGPGPHHGPPGPWGWRAYRQPFQPDFNVVETPTSFELSGDLPGLSNRDNVTVEWRDSQTLVVSGHIDRSTPATSDEEEAEKEAQKEPSDEAEKQLQSEKKDQTVINEKEVHFEDNSDDELEESVFISRPTTPGVISTTEQLPSYRAATVEDTFEPEATPDTLMNDDSAAPTANEKGKAPATEDDQDKEPKEPKRGRCGRGRGEWGPRGRCGGGPGMWAGRRGGCGKDKEGRKYWARERRSFGEFKRTFTFGANVVEHEGVTAALKDGVLKISVPKREKVPARRIEIL